MVIAIGERKARIISYMLSKHRPEATLEEIQAVLGPSLYEDEDEEPRRRRSAHRHSRLVPVKPEPAPLATFALALAIGIIGAGCVIGFLITV